MARASHKTLLQAAIPSDISSPIVTIYTNYSRAMGTTSSRPPRGGRDRKSCGGDKGNCDIRLSSAALLSARFPIISPHGNLRHPDGQIVGRAVDGGYFENFGAITAQEITAALREQNLKPFVLLVSNDPELSESLPCISRPPTHVSGTTPMISQQ